jgi:hypothetical protein
MRRLYWCHRNLLLLLDTINLRKSRQQSSQRELSQAWQQQQQRLWRRPQQSRLAVLLARQRCPPLPTLSRNLQNSQRHRHQWQRQKRQQQQRRVWA